jgi:predicted metal-dependent enzyme (double-stranded beta helix superfamily)
MTLTVGYQGTMQNQDRLARLVGDVAAQPDSWHHLVRFNAARRWYHRLELADDHEVWLLSWLPGQHTGFHDHGEAVGAFAVARGQLAEHTVPAGQSQYRSTSVAAGTVRSFGPQYVHDVVNADARRAVSVHAYSPPLTAMRGFELTAGGLVQVGTKQARRDW